MPKIKTTLPLKRDWNGTEEWLIGAHLSSAKGCFNAITSSIEIGANACGLFLKNQRTWNCPPLSVDVIRTFREKCIEHGIDQMKQVLPHGSYLVNLANPDAEKRAKSYANFVDDLLRCEQLGIGLYNLHPGSTVGQCTSEESIRFIAESINKAHSETESVTIVLENMAGQGNIIGSRFEDLASVIEQVSNKQRIGICLDTCHLFGAGYDVRTKESFTELMQQFDRTVGLQYLKAMHLNDSLGTLGSCKDRHANIGKGKIGLEAFRFIMNDQMFKGIPLILETPPDEKSNRNGLDTYAQEIALLRSLHEQK